MVASNTSPVPAGTHASNLPIRCHIRRLVLSVRSPMPGSGYSVAGRRGPSAAAGSSSQGGEDAGKKILTNDDIASCPDSAATVAPAPETNDAKASAADRSARPSPKVSAEHWKSQIQAQKTVVSSLQAEIDRLNGSVHFVEADLYVNGAVHNQHQAAKQQEVERLQSQLQEQKKKLEEMQDSARKEGYGSSVYEP
jgi:hypothetical protein